MKNDIDIMVESEHTYSKNQEHANNIPFGWAHIFQSV